MPVMGATRSSTVNKGQVTFDMQNYVSHFYILIKVSCNLDSSFLVQRRDTLQKELSTVNVNFPPRRIHFSVFRASPVSAVSQT